MTGYLEIDGDTIIIRIRVQGSNIHGNAVTVLEPGVMLGHLTYDQIKSTGLAR
jgi:hypothetical protein